MTLSPARTARTAAALRFPPLHPSAASVIPGKSSLERTEWNAERTTQELPRPDAPEPAVPA